MEPNQRQPIGLALGTRHPGRREDIAMAKFKFDHNKQVTILGNGERGEVIDRIEQEGEGQNRYLVRFPKPEGAEIPEVENWYVESDLDAGDDGDNRYQEIPKAPKK
jgi:hypothetical protein